MGPKKRMEPTREQAVALAIGALGFLAQRPEALGRFLALAGIGPETLRSAAAEPGFLAGLLDYFLANEGLLVDYAAEAGMAPEEIVRARARLEK
jgi:hypothetical protein